MRQRWLTSGSLVLLLTLNTSWLLANPQGFELIQGEAKPHILDDGTLTVETGHQAILHWKEFSIAEGETTRFVMPDSNSHVLNRVTGNNLSEIYGMLEANGKVLLVNPKGVVFGENAYIDTSAFIASSLDVLDADFLKNGELLFIGDSSSSIVNLGMISAWDGDVALIGYQVVNKGEIAAPHGVASLAAGTHILFRPLANERIVIRVSVPDEKVDVGIENSGAIQAIAAELKADGHLYHYAIKDSSKIDALGLENREGRIFLVADQGALSAQGSYNARSETGAGGSIRFLGDVVRIEEGAEIFSSGEISGGQVLIGGDYQGKNPVIPNAKVTYVAPNAHISADATLSGDGGKVILWGDTATGFYGTISAQGGSICGDGGFVEISSPGYLAFEGQANTSAIFGKTGMLLLDPSVVTIASNGGTDSGATFNSVPNCLAGTASSYSFTGASSTIDNGNLGTHLNTCNVTINASTAGGSATAGTITLAAGSPVTWTSGSMLTLVAQDGGSTIMINDLFTASGGGSLNINDGGTNNAAVTIEPTGADNAGFLSNSVTGGGSVSIQAGSVLLMGGASPDASAEISGNFANTPITITTGSLTLTGGTRNGTTATIYTDDALLSIVCNGLITLTGGTMTGALAAIESDTNGALSIQSIGLTMSEGSSFTTLQTTSGNLTIDGFSAGAGNSGAITLNGSSSINTAAGGAILIGKNGTSEVPTDLSLLSGSGDANAQIFTQEGGDIISVISGDYTITGGTTSFAAIYASGGSGDVNLSGGDLTITGGTGNSEAYLETNLGSITLTMAGDITVDGSTYQAFIETSGSGSAGDLTISGASLTLTGGSASNDYAILTTLNGGNISVTSSGLVELTALTGVGYAQIMPFAGGNLSIESVGLTMNSEATGTGASLQTTTGNLTIDGFNPSSSGVISLTGNSTISTTTGDISIGLNGTSQAPTGLELTGGPNGDASISTSNSGNISIACFGPVELTAGTAGFALIAPSLNTNLLGNLSIQSIGLTLSGPNGNGASLITGGGNISIDGFSAGVGNSGAISLTGLAQISTMTGGAITIGGLAPAKQLPTDLSVTGDPTLIAGPASITTQMNGAITSTISGDYTVTSGASIAFIATNSAGDITLNGGSLTVTSSTATVGASSIQTGLNDIVISCNGLVTVSAGTGTAAMGIPAIIISADNLTIRSMGLTMNGEITTSGIASLQTTTGDIKIDGFSAAQTGAIMLNGNNTLITTTTGDILIGKNGTTLVPTNLTIQGDGNVTTSSGQIWTQSGGDIISTISGDYTVAALTSSFVSILTSGSTGSNNISLTGSGLTVGGSSSSIQETSQINSNAGNITLDMGSGSITVDGPSNSGIATITAGLGISMMAAGGVTLQDNASISTFGTGSAGNLTMSPSGPILMTAPSNVGSPTISTSSGGAIAITGTSLTMNAGIDSSDSPEINTSSGGNISISCNGLVELNGGMPGMVTPGFSFINSSSALSIQSIGLTMNGNGNFVTILTTSGDLSIDGYDANNSGPIFLGNGVASIVTNTGGAINIGLNGNLVPTSLTLQGSDIITTGVFAQIYTINGGDITCNISGDYIITGGNQPNSSVAIETFSGGDISLTGGSITLAGGTGASAMASTAMISPLSQGAIIITCNNLTVTGGENMSPAEITTGMGDVTVTCSGDCTFDAPNADSPAQLQTFGSDLTMTVAGSASFMGNTMISTPAPTGNLTIIAGANLSIGGNAMITALGSPPLSSLTLVCDNDFPSPPKFGPGQFNLTGNAIVSAGMGSPVWIFTSRREQNTITTMINNATFVPGPEYVDSATEQWGVYYPGPGDPFGGFPFTIFYKFDGVTITTFNPQPAITAFGFLSSQGFFDLDEMDEFVYFDWYRWSTFTSEVNTKEGYIDRKGHSIRMRRGELLKNNGPRGFVLL